MPWACLTRRSRRWSTWRSSGSRLGWVAVGIGALYMVHAAFPLAYLHPADPAELLVYTQTSTDVQRALHQIDAVASRKEADVMEV